MCCWLGRLQFPRYVNACSLFITAHSRVVCFSFVSLLVDKAASEVSCVCERRLRSEINVKKAFVNQRRKRDGGAISLPIGFRVIDCFARYLG